MYAGDVIMLKVDFIMDMHPHSVLGNQGVICIRHNCQVPCMGGDCVLPCVMSNLL